jgi:transposase
MDVSEDVAYYVGVDWAAELHAVCVLDHRGKIVTSFPVAHSAEGIMALVARLARLDSAEEIPIGIERHNGRLVDLLLEAGHPVVPVSRNAIKTWRDDEVLSRAKSDAGDAAVIAEYLRLRAHRLRTVVRTCDDLVQMRVAAANQLAALLDTH